MVDTDVYIETDDIKYRFARVSCKRVDVSQNKRMTDKMKWRRNHHSTEKKRRVKRTNNENDIHTHECTNVVKCSIQWDANGKNRDESRKSHQNTSIYKYMLESIVVYISVRCKQFQPYTTLKFAQPRVLLARLSPSETIHLVVVPVPRRDS